MTACRCHVRFSGSAAQLTPNNQREHIRYNTALAARGDRYIIGLGRTVFI